jgi:hypothetical protein
MRKSCPIAAVLAVLALVGGARAARVPADLTFDAAEIRTSNLRPYTRISLPGTRSLSVPGEPDLPARVLHFVIPSDARVEDVVISSLGEEELSDTYRVMPAQPEAPIGGTPEWADPDPAIYGSDALFPSSRVEYLGDGYLGGYRIASVAVYPIQYAPATGRLIMATDISVDLELAPGADRSRARYRMTEDSDRLYRELVEGLVYRRWCGR